MTGLGDDLVFHDDRLAKRYQRAPIPIATLYEAYFDGALDLNCDLCELLENRRGRLTYRLGKRHVAFALASVLPELAGRSKERDERLLRAHFDRGDDFFRWFLGERMFPTAGFFSQSSDSLECAQDHAMSVMCETLQLKPGERLLDIGCGWGTLATYAARFYGADVTAVTIAQNQAQGAERRARAHDVASGVRVLCNDYRDIPSGTYDKICSVEFVPHVGWKNVRAFYEKTRELLHDDGLLLVQWTGMRRALRPEDLLFGLFKTRHVAPGADASLCPSAMLAALEKAGFEAYSVENVGSHYALTAERWLANWIANRDAVVAVYGERAFRIWHFFLAWSRVVARRGHAGCFQVLLHKNEHSFDRARFIGRRSRLHSRVPRLSEFELTDMDAAE